jgi:hypothetical protein
MALPPGRQHCVTHSAHFALARCMPACSRAKGAGEPARRLCAGLSFSWRGPFYAGETAAVLCLVLVRGSRAAVAPQGGQGGLGGPQSSASTRRRERIPTCLGVIRALVCRRCTAVGVISARMSPVGITVGSDHDGRLSLSARLLLTAIRWRIRGSIGVIQSSGGK